MSDDPQNADQAPSGPWLAAKSSGQTGRLPWFYVTMGVGTAILFLALLAMDAVLIVLGFGLGDALGFGGRGLEVSSDLGGIALVAGFAIVITFIGVLWPLGFLSQMLLYFALFSRALRAPKGAAIAEMTTFGGMGPTVDALVQTQYSLRWTNIGNIGWLPNWQLLVGGYGFGLALTIASAFDEWRFNGADPTAMIVAMIVAVGGGTVFLVLGVRARLAKLASQAAAALHKIELAKRSAHRQDLRRAKLTSQERAAEDAKLAEILGPNASA